THGGASAASDVYKRHQTGYAINPARDLGPRIAHAILPIFGKGTSNWGYAIVPVLGPIAGGMLGAVIYRLFYKGAFDIMSIVTIVVVIITLVIGVLLNKADKTGEVEAVK
ncbi:aquaporin, partial [Staphylococcus arlettae]